MAYIAPYLDETGLHIPTYEDRLQALLDSYRSIFGMEVNLAESAPDYQLLSVFARALDDLSAGMVDLFASRNPNYAAGTALDFLLPLHGLSRSGATYSTVFVTLTGQPSATLASGPQVMDDRGYIWACTTDPLTMREDGTLTIRATCTTAGAIEAEVGTVTRIITPISGLYSVTNETAATPGVDAETDASARERMRLAAAAPSLSIAESLRMALLAIPGVVDSKLYINETDTTDDKGIPGHSICAVMVGGTTTNIGKVLFAKKAPGIGTYGTKSTTVTDAFGETHTVRFSRAAWVAAYPQIRLHPLDGFNRDVIIPKMQEALDAYLSGIRIAQPLTVTSLYGICCSVEAGQTPTFYISSLSILLDDTYYTTKIDAAWNEYILCSGDACMITVDT